MRQMLLQWVISLPDLAAVALTITAIGIIAGVACGVLK